MKKWTFLLAAGLLAGATPVFTGCIDNDEPEGITILRGAKAELIRAKKTVADAEAQQKLAEAEIKKAEAKIKEAEAEIKKAQAEQIKAETEAEKAKLEAIIKKLEAEAQQAIAEAEAAAQAAKDAHEQAVAQLEILKAQLNGEQQKNLQFWMDAYKTAKGSYEDAYLEWVAASREYTKALADAEEEDPGLTRDLEWAVIKAKADLKNAQAAKTLLEEALDDAKTWEPGELAVKKADIQKKIDELNKKIVELELQVAEAKKANKAEYDKLNTLEMQVLDEFKKPLELLSHTQQFPELGIPGFQGDMEIVPEGYQFSLQDLRNYLAAQSLYDHYIDHISGLALDENDQEWQKQSLLDLDKKVKAVEKAHNGNVELWQNAVKAYNTADGKVNVPGYGQPYTDLDAAIQAYNEALPAYDAAQAAAEAARLKVEAAVANEAATKEFREIYFETLNKIDDAYEAFKLEKENSYYKQLGDFQSQTHVLLTNFTEKRNAADKAKFAWEKEPTEANKKAWDQALEAQDKAYAAYEKHMADSNKAMLELERKIKKEVENAGVQVRLDKVDAEVTYRRNIEKYGAEKDPALQAAINQAIAEWTPLVEKAKAATEKVDGLFYKAMDAKNELYKVAKARANYIVKDYKALDINKVVSGITRATAKNAVIEYSRLTWGETYAFNDQDGNYNIPQEYLLPLTEEKLREFIAYNLGKMGDSDVQPWEISEYYANVTGSFAQMLAKQYEYKVGEAYLNNAEVVKTAVADLEAAKAALTALMEAQEKVYEDTQAALEAQQIKIDELEQPLWLAIDAARVEQATEREVLKAVNKAIGDLPSDDPSTFDEEHIKEVVRALEANIEEKTAEIYELETAVMVAEKALKDWNSGDLEVAEAKKHAMEDAEWLMKKAEEMMNAAKADLDREMAKLEKAAE